MHWTSLYLSLEAIDLPNTGIFFDPRSRRRKNWNRTTRSTRPIERKGYLILVIEGLSPREILETRRKIGKIGFADRMIVIERGEKFELSLNFGSKS